MRPTKEQMVQRLVDLKAIQPGCKDCEPFFADPGAFGPKHANSALCRSGKRPHCSCSACF